MSDGGIKMGTTPPHPGTFIRIEALEELGLSVAAAARLLGVRLSDALGPGERQRLTVARDDAQGRESVRPQHGPAVADASVAQMRARANEIDVQRYQPA